MNNPTLTDDVLELLRRCGGYYKCPESVTGELLGPLVAYAGRYLDVEQVERQYVGKVYYNFAQAEQYSHVRNFYAREVAGQLRGQGLVLDAIIGAPMGGILISADIARHYGCHSIFAEKKTTTLSTASSREKSILLLDRHNLQPGWGVAVGEDLVNNSSTTQQIEQLVRDAGAELVAITCVLNRSDREFYRGAHGDIPIVSLLHLPTEQFQQDHPEVAAHVAAGNVVWKPKTEWPRLEAAWEGAKR